MSVRISWGKRIAILYLGFVALIVVLVVGSMRQDFDLVSKDYYAQEIAYQNTLDAGKNQASLSNPVGLFISAESIKLKFPVEFADKLMNTELHFYSPVNSSLDRKYYFKAHGDELVISRKELEAANYRLKISWAADTKKYYQETEVNLSK